MRFQLKRKESLARGARRLIQNELAMARCELKSKDLSIDEQVHELRRHTKRVRAILKLIRDGLGSKVYRSENHRLAQVARRFSDVRDARACADAFDSILDTAEVPIFSEKERNEKKCLFRTRLEQAHEQQATNAGFREALRQIRSVRYRVARWKIRQSDEALIERGFGRVYSAGRHALKNVRIQPDHRNLHTLRKVATSLRIIVEILSTRFPRLHEFHRALQLLTADSGKCLDFGLLKSVLLEEAQRSTGGHAMESVIRQIGDRHCNLLAHVLQNAEEIFRRKTSHQLRRLKIRQASS